MHLIKPCQSSVQSPSCTISVTFSMLCNKTKFGPFGLCHTRSHYSRICNLAFSQTGHIGSLSNNIAPLLHTIPFSFQIIHFKSLYLLQKNIYTKIAAKLDVATEASFVPFVFNARIRLYSVPKMSLICMEHFEG